MDIAYLSEIYSDSFYNFQKRKIIIKVEGIKFF